MPSLESTISGIVVHVSRQLAPSLVKDPAIFWPRSHEAATEQLLRDLGAEAGTLLAYLRSPDFAVLIAQLRVWPSMREAATGQMRQGLRLAGIPEEFLARTVDVMGDVLTSACDSARTQFRRPSARIDPGRVIASAADSGGMLARLESLTEFHDFASRMRSQIVALHSKIRLPHVGVSRAVRYEELYVRPSVQTHKGPLGAPGDRRVILGDPGAGKSTFAAKFAHDIASDESGRVPFLLVLRDFTPSFDGGGRALLHYLEKVCQEPYNLVPPADAVEYLLRSGRAVVVLDGLDEVVRTESRRRVVKLVEGFAHAYPLVPILVTARRIGYADAPLPSDLFTTAQILDFTEEQVRTYVERWFVLDEATTPAEQQRLVASFMDDSNQIPELRNNPLLLTLLCAMYSSDRYLPQNLAQVYERCALMLFEQWDSKRGIPLSMKFRGRLRGAVQHLAWEMFTARESGKAQSRTRIVNTLTAYLEGMLDDHDESAATAEQFLEFCTGRAWILTDVGATSIEPRFGFTHRTFLEYFAAEHLVRTHRTAKDLWAQLNRNTTQFEVVAQIVLQLHDRNVAGGVDELLLEALGRGGLDFAARSLHHVHPSTRTVRTIAITAVHQSVRAGERVMIGKRDFSCTDKALHHCLYSSSPANLQVIEKAVAEELGPLIQQHMLGAVVVLDSLGHHDQPAGTRWREIRRELRDRHHEDLTRVWHDSPWGAAALFAEPESLEQLIQRFGVSALYVSGNVHHDALPSAARSLLHNDVLPFPQSSASSLADAIAAQPTPWAPQSAFAASDVILNLNVHDERTDGLRLMLALPFFELFCTYRTSRPWASAYALLVDGRTDDNARDAALQWLDKAGFSPRTRAFLDGWVRGAISVTMPDPWQRPPLPKRPRPPRSAAHAGTSPAPAASLSRS